MNANEITLTQAAIVCAFVTVYGLGLWLAGKVRGE